MLIMNCAAKSSKFPSKCQEKSGLFASKRVSWALFQQFGVDIYADKGGTRRCSPLFSVDDKYQLDDWVRIWSMSVMTSSMLSCGCVPASR